MSQPITLLRAPYFILCHIVFKNSVPTSKKTNVTNIHRFMMFRNIIDKDDCPLEFDPVLSGTFTGRMRGTVLTSSRQLKNTLKIDSARSSETRLVPDKMASHPVRCSQWSRERQVSRNVCPRSKRVAYVPNAGRIQCYGTIKWRRVGVKS
jgi:hypothetical protein